MVEESRWILVAGNRRCGTTVLYHYVREMVEQTKQGRGVGYLVSKMEMASAHIPPIPEMDQTPWLKVGHLHIPTQELDAIIRQQRVQVVWVYRDWRDMLASQVRQAHQPLDLMMSRVLSPRFNKSLLLNESYWTGVSGAVSIRYEAMIADPVLTMQYLVDRLRLDVVSEEIMQSIAEQYTIDRVKNDPDMTAVTQMDAGGAVAEGGARKFLTNHITSDGQPGGYRNTFAPREIEWLESQPYIRQWLKDHKYPLGQ